MAELIERMEAHAAAAALADNTVRALAADSRVFALRCRANGHRALPAPPATVAAFIDAQAALIFAAPRTAPAPSWCVAPRATRRRKAL